MTTENVTVLFTDMVGSTALASSLTPDAADELRRGHFAILRQAVAEAGGTEVKNLGDGLMVVLGASSAALSCAVAMQQGIERDNRGREHSVGLRVGLSGGEVSREEGDYFGDPVIEAARLCARCESGQVLAADIVRLTAGRRSRRECHSLGGLTLMGLPDPVETVEVLWEPLGGAGTGPVVPLPGRLGVRPAAGVVGREAEMVAMLDAFKRVAGGEGREVFLISGEAGLGKTTLAAETARAASDGGACVLFGHCEEDLATPYQLFAEALGHYVTHAPEEQLVAHVDAHGSELVRLVPALSSRLPGLPPSKATDADTERYQLFAAVVGLLAVVSQHQPVVVVLDDLQWADKASLQLLRHLIAADQPMRLLVLGSYRDSELSRSHPLLETLAGLHREHGVARIELTGLDDTGVISLMEAAAGHTLDDAAVGLARAVYRETDGNPFFVSEMLRHLSETGAIYQDSTGRWVTGDTLEQLALPDSVRVVIGARAGRLGRDAERVLSLAAVIGRDFDLDVLARATETSEDELLDVLDAATAASLVRELADTPGHYNFAHALIQHTLYEDLGLTRQGRAHRQVAEALEDLCGERPGFRVGELARHWFSATQPIDVGKAIDYSAGRATPRLVRSPPPTPFATTPRPSTSTRSATAQIRSWASTWPSGSAPPNARRETPPFARPSSAPLAGPLTSATRGGSWPPPWPTTGACSPLPARSTPTRSRSWSWRSIGSPPTIPTGRSCSPPCVVSSSTGAPSSVFRLWPTRPSPSPNPPATTPSSCGSSTMSRSRSACRHCSDSRWFDRPTPCFGPSGSVTQSCCSGPLGNAQALPAGPRTSTRWTAAWRSWGRSLSSSTSRT
ncbi:MAG: AAA family ATPase [Ilumatobacteraceae bacterium]